MAESRCASFQDWINGRMPWQTESIPNSPAPSWSPPLVGSASRLTKLGFLRAPGASRSVRARLGAVVDVSPGPGSAMRAHGGFAAAAAAAAVTTTGRCEWPVDERPRHQQPPTEPYEVASRPAAPAQCDAASARRSLAWLVAWLAAWLPSRRLAARTNKQGQGIFRRHGPPPSQAIRAGGVASRDVVSLTGARHYEKTLAMECEADDGACMKRPLCTTMPPLPPTKTETREETRLCYVGGLALRHWALSTSYTCRLARRRLFSAWPVVHSGTTWTVEACQEPPVAPEPGATATDEAPQNTAETTLLVRTPSPKDDDVCC
ncbi:hypothetical protein ACCO45_006889 [Purpureocillium lilacinum]|uniref:Uncharacterized protein n=1 Tax=Purpureocillium lilacinum TaxID=33203 RepID=A0ACC4DS73_PURLI